MNVLASWIAFTSRVPLASSAVMAAEYAQPVPWVCGVSIREAETRGTRRSVYKISIASPRRWPPLIRTFAAPSEATSALLAASSRDRLRRILPALKLHEDSGSAESTGIEPPHKSVPCLPIITGSTTRGKSKCWPLSRLLRRPRHSLARPFSRRGGGYPGSLRGSELRPGPGHHFNTVDAVRVLDGDEGYDGLAVDAELVKCLEIGLNAGAAARVGSCDGERDGRSFLHVTGTIIETSDSPFALVRRC